MLRVTQEAVDRGRAVIWVFNKIDEIEDILEWRKEIDRQIDFRLRHWEFIPRLEISAKSGKGLKKLFPMIEKVAEAHNRRLETGPLNRLIERALIAHSPPIVKNRPLKIFYVSQPSVRPPTFVLFTNAPEGVHFSYERYLLRTIRESDDFIGTPIRLTFKKRGEKGGRKTHGSRSKRR